MEGQRVLSSPRLHRSDIGPQCGLHQFAVLLLVCTVCFLALVALVLDRDLARERLAISGTSPIGKATTKQQHHETPPAVTMPPVVVTMTPAPMTSTTTISPAEPKPNERIETPPPPPPVTPLPPVERPARPTTPPPPPAPLVAPAVTSGKPVLHASAMAGPPAKLISLPSAPIGPAARSGTDSNYDDHSPLVSSTAVEILLPGPIGSIRSPSGRAELTVFVGADGRTGYRVVHPETGKVLLGDAWVDLKLEFKMCIYRQVSQPTKTEVHYQIASGLSHWTPVGGGFERSQYREPFTSLQTWCEGSFCQQCTWKMEWRLFDQGLGVRALVKPDLTKAEVDAGKMDADAPEEWVHVHYGLHIAFPKPVAAGSALTCWASNLEEAYQPRPCDRLAQDGVMVPLTAMVHGAGRPSTRDPATPSATAYSILQAGGFGYTQSLVTSVPPAEAEVGVETVHVVTKGEVLRRPADFLAGQQDVVHDDDLGGTVSCSSWHAILWAADELQLVDHSSIVRLLAPPTSPAMAGGLYAEVDQWVKPGKLLRLRKFDTAEAHALIDFASGHGYQYVHFDAGWYGPENDPASSAKQVHPSLAHELDMREVTKYAHSRHPRVRVSVYVNELALRDTAALVDIYRAWGLDGVKFGFVDLARPSAVRQTHERMVAFARGHMWVNIHDAYRMRGFTRTYPHLLTSEGVRGQEHTPECDHHAILPFVRFLAGAADYTPRYSEVACSRMHQLALGVLFFSPIQSLFWRQTRDTIEHQSATRKELRAVWERMPTVWQDTRMLQGALPAAALDSTSGTGSSVTVARRTERTWFVGTVNGDGRERTVPLDLGDLFRSSLPPSEGYSWHPPLPALAPDGYVLEVWADASWTDEGAEAEQSRKSGQLGGREVQYLYLASTSVSALLAGGSGATAPGGTALPGPLAAWATKNGQEVTIASGWVLSVVLAPSGGHCMRILPANDFLAEAAAEAAKNQ